MQSQPTSNKITFDQYTTISSKEEQTYKQPLSSFLENHGFFKTFYRLDSYFEQYSNDPVQLLRLVHVHSICLYSLVKERMVNDPSEEVNVERMEQFLQFMYRADVESERISETLNKLKLEQSIITFESNDDMIEFTFKNGPVFDLERNKFKQILLDTIQHYTVDIRLKNYRFDFEILVGVYRLIFERNGYMAPPRSDPNMAIQDSLGETDLYAELLKECGMTL